MIKPIRPEEIEVEKLKILPDYVIKAWNNMIAKKWNGSSSSFKQDDIVAEILEYAPATTSVTRNEVFDNKYLDVEGIYRKEGWKVTYDKPAYCETYAATFEFRK